MALAAQAGRNCWQHRSPIGGHCGRRSHILPCDSLRLRGVIWLAVAEPDVFGPTLLVLRVLFIMAVPAGRSVVFVTGNAKKLEEVRVRRFITQVDYLLSFGLSRLNHFRQETSSLSVQLNCCSSRCLLNIDSEHELQLFYFFPSFWSHLLGHSDPGKPVPLQTSVKKDWL